MARSIDSIVAAHRTARELRAAGKPIWTYTAEIRPIINESRDQSVERVVDVANRIARTLRERLPAAFFDVTSDDYEMHLDEAVEDLESYTVASLSKPGGEDVEAVEMLNGRLEELYDWADRARVWLG
ncbi:hypothetical protein [Sphingomonas sp. 3-13AW]|uniref:hypothetical protein n=1 Tax=Sphingomonas sp. 3-13AW TaxID=3050450 RepID=UPI003BB674F5